MSLDLESPLRLLWEETKLNLPHKKILDDIEKYGNLWSLDPESPKKDSGGYLSSYYLLYIR